MLFRTRVLRLLLVALLIFSQQQAVLHLLGHGLAKLSQQEPTEPQELACAKCLAIAHLDHAVSGEVPAFASIDSSPGRLTATPVPHRDLAFFASYRSRAPPVPS